MKKAVFLIAALLASALLVHPAEAQNKRKVVFGVPVTP